MAAARPTQTASVKYQWLSRSLRRPQRRRDRFGGRDSLVWKHFRARHVSRYCGLGLSVHCGWHATRHTELHRGARHRPVSWEMSVSQSPQPKAFWRHADRIGIVASGLCFVHCVLTPVIVSLLAVGAHYFPSEERIHRVLALSVAALGGVAIFFGFSRHRRFRVVVLMSVGLCLIFAGAYFGSRLPSHLAEVAVTMAGSCFMISGHFLNHTFCRNCERCDPPVSDTHEPT